MSTAQKISNTVMDETGNYIDPKFLNTVSQYAHFGMMFTVTTILGLLGFHFGHLITMTVIGVAVCLIYAAIHEFLWDPKMENAATRGSDLQDFIFLAAGSGVACLFLLVLL